MDALTEMTSFYEKIMRYEKLVIKWSHTSLPPNATENEEMQNLRTELQRDFSRLENAIARYGGSSSITDPISGKKQNVFDIAFDTIDIFNVNDNLNALNRATKIVNKAIGKLVAEGESWEIEKTGITKKTSKEPPKAFIAHEGETEQLKKLKGFLEALGIKYLIAESQASNGRSIEGQVDWTMGKADFAICLATKGKAVNKKTRKHYMGLNVAEELGRARKVFGNKIILLAQKGVEVQTNTREIVYETFTTQSMDMAFTKIVKELRNWGFIKVGKIEEHQP